MTEPTQECANCGAPGNPGHHWMSGIGYVCFNKDGGEDTPPPLGHAAPES